MKNLLIAILFISILSCQPTATQESDEPPFEIIDTAPSMYAVSLKSAEKNVRFYDRVSKNVLGMDTIKAFTLRSVDLAEAIGLPVKYLSKAKYRHVRMYMGVDSVKGEFKIYLTPVEGAKLSAGIPGKDVILSGPYQGVKGDLADGDGPYVMDFSQPCPNACDDDSPLFD